MKRIALIAALFLGLRANGATSVSLEISGVTSNNTYLTATNMIGAAGEVVQATIHCPTNVTFKIDTVAGTGASYLSRSLVAAQGVTNQLVLFPTNTFIANDAITLSAKAAGLTTTNATTVKATLIIRER